MRKPGFILQLKIDRDLATLRTGKFPFPDESLIAQRSKLIHAEVSVNRIDADDCGKLSGISLYQVANIHQLAADASVDRRCNVSKFKIQLGRIACRLRRDHLRRGLVLVGQSRIVIFLRDDARLSQSLLASEGSILQLLIGLRLLQLANRLVVSILIWSRIDLKEQIAFVDNVAFFKGNIDNVTADPRRYCHQLDRCRSAGELVPIHHLLLLRVAARDLGRWWALRRWLLVVAAG